MIIPQKFYLQPTELVARGLLGKLLVHETEQGTTVGRIVETEAYLANDPASHAYKGKTPHNSPMFGPPGRAYLYSIYGMHCCFNIVTNRLGCAEAVLLRALEPLDGIELMRKRRGKSDLVDLASGPAKLVQAMGLSRENNMSDITSLSLYVTDEYASFSTLSPDNFICKVGPRVGIRHGADLPLRFSIAHNPYVSRSN